MLTDLRKDTPTICRDEKKYYRVIFLRNDIIIFSPLHIRTFSTVRENLFNTVWFNEEKYLKGKTLSELTPLHRIKQKSEIANRAAHSSTVESRYNVPRLQRIHRYNVLFHRFRFNVMGNSRSAYNVLFSYPPESTFQRDSIVGLERALFPRWRILPLFSHL